MKKQNHAKSIKSSTLAFWMGFDLWPNPKNHWRNWVSLCRRTPSPPGYPAGPGKKFWLDNWTHPTNKNKDQKWKHYSTTPCFAFGGRLWLLDAARASPCGRGARVGAHFFKGRSYNQNRIVPTGECLYILIVKCLEFNTIKCLLVSACLKNIVKCLDFNSIKCLLVSAYSYRMLSGECLQVSAYSQMF